MRNGLVGLTSMPSRRAIRSRISRAALLVNVTQKMLLGSIPFSRIIETTLSVIVCVFPDHAHALIRSGQLIVSTASRCAGLRLHMFGSIEKYAKKSRKFLKYSVLCYTPSHSYLLYAFSFPSRSIYWRRKRSSSATFRLHRGAYLVYTGFETSHREWLYDTETL